MIDWNDLKYVLAVARAGTLSRAATQLKVDQTTVTRRIKQLEMQLGATLFHRHSNRLVATEAGEELIKTAEVTENKVLCSTELIAGTDLKCVGKVRITAVPVVINDLIARQIPNVLQMHPGLAIELMASAENFEFSKRQTDIAVRFARPTSGIAVCRKIADLSYSVYSSIHSNAQLQPYIGLTDNRQHLPQAQWLKRHARQQASAQLFVDDAQTAIAAIKAGYGRAVLPDLIMKQQSEVACCEQNVLSRPVWLLIHPEMRHLTRIRIVVEFLSAIFAAD